MSEEVSVQHFSHIMARPTDNTMAKRKNTKGQTMIYKIYISN